MGVCPTGWWPTHPVAQICLPLADVGLFIPNLDTTPNRRHPTTDTSRLSHPTVTVALSHPPPLSEHSPRGEGVVSLASVRAHSVDLQRVFDISACPAAAAGLIHTCMECMTKLCHTSMQSMVIGCMICMYCMTIWPSKSAPNRG